MSVRVAIDANVLGYAEGVGDAPRCQAALDLLDALPRASVLLPAQVLGELHHVLMGKAKRPAAAAQAAVMSWADAFEVVDSRWSAFEAAFSLSADHGLRTWDALLLAVVAENRCRLLLSEDLQNGFTWSGVTVVDPFLRPHPPLLAGLLTRA